MVEDTLAKLPILKLSSTTVLLFVLGKSFAEICLKM